MHGKDQAVAPVFGERLDLLVDVAEGLDTDSLGTFTGEVKRFGDMAQTVRQKARAALSGSGYTIGIATEGSFGPSPVFPTVPLHTECMIFLDTGMDLELLMFEESLDTNFAHLLTSDLRSADAFLKKAGFPEHGIILKPGRPTNKDVTIVKGVKDRQLLEDSFQRLSALSEDRSVHLEADMRAHMNPSRMKVIRDLAEKMCDRLMSACPSCNTPGWGAVDTEKGLPCESCGFKTQMVRYLIFGCTKCSHREKKGRPDGIAFAGAGSCPVCNP